MAVQHITTAQFQTEVLDFPGTVLLDFWATWCGPCRMIAPIVEQIAEENPDIKVCKIDVDENMELAMQFQVASIPTLVVMKNGKMTASTVGAVPKAQILAML